LEQFIGFKNDTPDRKIRLAENYVEGYLRAMTTAQQFRESVSRAACEVSVAGVPWPLYKLYALAVGLVVLLVVGVATMSAAPAVLSAAGAATAVWLVFSSYCSSGR
jgi:Flp pilus assembly protein TadB